MRLSKIFLSLVVALMFTILLSSVTACNYQEEEIHSYDATNDYLTHNIKVDITNDYAITESSSRSGCSDVNCVNCQYERLRQLRFWEVTEAFNSNGEPIYIPIVTNADYLVSRDYFLVELMHEPTQDCIDFILSHTGIPQERANIVQTDHTRSYIWGFDFDFAESVECIIYPAHDHEDEIDVENDFPILDRPVKRECYMTFCYDCQLRRLNELTDNRNIIIALDSDGEPFNIPLIHSMLPPMRNRDYFHIGLVDEPTSKCINFILSYTGIQQERAYITKGYSRLATVIDEYD